jgi:hypothetical protein
MDYIMAFLVILMGVIPPILVGYWAYRQGLKGRREAIALRDEAIEQVGALRKAIDVMDARWERHMDDIRDEMPTIEEIMKAMPKVEIPPFPEIPPYPKVPTVDEIVAALPPVRIPEDQMESLKSSLKGILGNFVKQGIAGAELEIEGSKAERVQQDPAAAFQGAIMTKILKFLNKD